MIEFIKAWLIPGSLSFLLIGMLAGVLLLFSGKKVASWGRRLLFGLLLLYWALSTPLVSGLLVDGLSRGYRRASAVELAGVEAIVVLGGGGASYLADGEEIEALSEQSALRALEGLRLYRHMDQPWVVLSGGSNPAAGLVKPESLALRQVFLEAGVPEARLLLESRSENTYDQALYIPQVLEQAGVNRFVLVTSPTHMRRADLTFRAQGLEPLPSLARQRSESIRAPAFGLLPDSGSLQVSQTAMREVLALIYYALQGWI